MADAGILLSMTFNERSIVNEQIYKKILFDKLSFNEGMLMENIVARDVGKFWKKIVFLFKK